jgi:hypothetical protein
MASLAAAAGGKFTATRPIASKKTAAGLSKKEKELVDKVIERSEKQDQLIRILQA